MNFKHLHYFWMVARSGSVIRASERLNLTPQTISAQIKLLEDELGAQLLRPAGRGLELTETGRLALGYADDIFSLGDELKAALAHHQNTPRRPFRVGITDAVPKAIAYRLLEPTAALPEPVRLICREGKLDRLLSELALHRLDMVIADRPIPPNINIRGHSHKLGESALAIYAAPEIAHRCSEFPACLDDAPLLMPGDDATVRSQLEHWLEEMHLAPQIVAEFDDSALMTAFGQAGGGLFPAPAVLATELEQQYAVRQIGLISSVHETFYAITSERQITHPAILAVTETAIETLTR